MNIARWIKKKREEKVLSQGDLARILGYGSGQIVSNWERGMSLPPRRSLRRLGTSFGVSERFLQRMLLESKVQRLVSGYLGDAGSRGTPK